MPKNLKRARSFRALGSHFHKSDAMVEITAPDPQTRQLKSMVAMVTVFIVSGTKANSYRHLLDTEIVYALGYRNFLYIGSNTINLH